MRVERFDADVGVETLNAEIKDLSGVDFVHIRHNFADLQNLNLISISRRRPEFRETLRVLVGQGFHLYKLTDATSSFVHHSQIKGLWTSVESGDIQYDENTIAYTLTPATVRKKEKLLVVLSSIAVKSQQSSLRRHFEHNFSSIQKYVTPNTNILRIADLGGVGGGWYRDTNYLSNNFENIQSLIKAQCKSLGLESSDVILLGVSKGGTAALHHGMKLGAKVVSVDPILSDKLYEEVYDDLHSTIGNFPQSKDDLFAELRTQGFKSTPGRISVVYSDMSPQFSYINDILYPWTSDVISFINSSHPEIKDHPDVSPCSMSTIIMLVNMKLHGLSLPPMRLDTPFGTKSSLFKR